MEQIRNGVRTFMQHVAVGLDKLSGGRISPDAVTLVGLVMHLPIAYLIATQHFYWAAGLLVVFGLFDSLDGALARLQHKASPAGMLLDESVVHDFCIELHRDKQVSDDTYEAAVALFGEQGVVDLVGLNGYYTFLAMVMNTARTAVPVSSAAPLPE